MDRILDKTMIFLRNNDNVDEEEIEIVRYGLELLFLKVLFTTAVLLVSALIYNFWQCLFFIIFFSLIRTLAGGYHASSRLQCFVQSMMIFVSVLLILKVENEYETVIVPIMILSIISSLIIWLLTPVDTENKRLEYDEIARFKRKSRIILCFEALLAVGAYILGFSQISCSVMLALIITAVLMIIEYIKKRLKVTA